MNHTLHTNNNKNAAVIYRFQIANSKQIFDIFIDIKKFSTVKFIKGAKYTITMLHNCLDNSLGFNLLFGREYDHTNLAISIRKAK